MAAAKAAGLAGAPQSPQRAASVKSPGPPLPTNKPEQPLSTPSVPFKTFKPQSVAPATAPGPVRLPAQKQSSAGGLPGTFTNSRPEIAIQQQLQSLSAQSSKIERAGSENSHSPQLQHKQSIREGGLPVQSGADTPVAMLPDLPSPSMTQQRRSPPSRESPTGAPNSAHNAANQLLELQRAYGEQVLLPDKPSNSVEMQLLRTDCGLAVNFPDDSGIGNKHLYNCMPSAHNGRRAPTSKICKSNWLSSRQRCGPPSRSATAHKHSNLNSALLWTNISLHQHSCRLASSRSVAALRSPRS